MKTCLITINRAFNSDFNSLYLKTKILRDKYDKIYLLNSYKTHKVLDKIYCHVDGVIDIYPHIEDTYAKKYVTWQEVYDAFDVSQVPHIDDVWVFAGIQSEGSKLIRKYPDNMENLLDKKTYMAYISLCTNFVKMYAALKIAHTYNAQVHEICYDPGEYSFSLLSGPLKLKKEPEVYHGYDIPHLNMKRLDSYQIGMRGESITPLLFDSYDLVYGYSYMTKARKHIHEEVQQLLDIPQFDIKVFCKNKLEDSDTFLSREEYLSYIHSANYTLIMPAYYPRIFSISRFLEAIKLDCLPFVHHWCEIEDVCKSFDITFDEILINTKEELINKLVGFSEQDRMRLINYYKEKMNI